MAKNKWLTARIDEDLGRRVEAAVHGSELTKSQILRESIRQFLKKRLRNGNEFEWQPEEE